MEFDYSVFFMEIIDNQNIIIDNQNVIIQLFGENTTGSAIELLNNSYIALLQLNGYLYILALLFVAVGLFYLMYKIIKYFM